MSQGNPIASGALASRPNKKSEGPDSGLDSQESHSRNGSLSTPHQLSNNECDFKRSLFVKKLPKISNLKEQLGHLFEDAGFKPTKVTFPNDVGRFRDFGFIEFSTTAIANNAMLKMDGAEFGGNTIKVEKADLTKVSRKGSVRRRSWFVGRQTRWDWLFTCITSRVTLNAMLRTCII